jgi:uncharacterized membrane protein YphA (DoxX/SURF4 family)
MAVNPSARGLTALRLFLGVFFLFEGIGKIAWLTDAGPLTAQLQGFLESANDWNRAYLQTVCLPGAAVFARVVPIAEFATGVAFLLGAYTRYAAIAALLMVLNFHFAGGFMFEYRYLTTGYGPPVLGGLLALALGGAALPLSLRK